MERKLSYPWLLLLTLLVGVAACTDDVLLEWPDESGKLPGVSISRVRGVPIVDKTVVEAMPLLDENEIICYFQMINDNGPPGEIYSVHAFWKIVRGEGQIELAEPLHIGRQKLLYFSYRRPGSSPEDPLVHTLGMGHELLVTEDGVEVIGKLDPDTKLMGSGTQEDPFEIKCDNDIYLLQGLVNNDETGSIFQGVYFEQLNDIDMAFISDYVNLEYGWKPIGYTNTRPFRGYYNGNGHTISNLRIDRPTEVIGGLFGCLYGAKIDNLVMKDAYVRTAAFSGAIAGAAIAAAGDNQPGGAYVSSQISHCSVHHSDVVAETHGGMIIGAADAFSRLYVDSCRVAADNTLTVDWYGGGAVGSGIFQSSVVLQEVSNYCDVQTTLGAAGGLIGTSDTLKVINGYNYGRISVAKAQDEEHYGAGGIAGGTGNAQFFNCINHGSVSGDRGVGGILGSGMLQKGDGTLDNPGIYNDAAFLTCINHAPITAYSHAGGICGEAQVNATSCGNFGDVTSHGDYAGGIVAAAPGLITVDCLNKGKITARCKAGGMSAFSTFGSLGFCNNYGNVSTTNGYSAGILSLGGGGILINYCGNYGSIFGGNGAFNGGIAGEMGKVREWSSADIATVVMGAIGIAASFVCLSVNISFYRDYLPDGRLGVVKDVASATIQEMEKTCAEIFHVVNTMIGIPNTVLAGFDIAWRVNPSSPWAEAERLAMGAALSERATAICDSLSAVRGAMNFQLALTPGIDAQKTWGEQGFCFEAERNRVFNSDETLDDYNLELDLRRTNLQAAAQESKELQNHAFDGVNGVMALATVGLFIAGFFTGGLAAAAVGIASSVVAIAFSANSIAKSSMNYQENACEISQCYNYGVVDGDENTGGIAGMFNDYGHLYDSYNAGTVTGNGSTTGLVLGNGGHKLVLVNTFDISANSTTNEVNGHRGDNPWRVEHNYRIDHAALPNMLTPSAYKGFNFDYNWLTPDASGANNYRLPIINQSEYARKEHVE